MAYESPKQVDDSVATSREMTRQRAWGDRPPHDEDTIDLSRFFRIIERHWIAVVLLSFYFASLRPLKYRGVTTRLVGPPSQPNGLQTFGAL